MEILLGAQAYACASFDRYDNTWITAFDATIPSSSNRGLATGAVQQFEKEK